MLAGFHGCRASHLNKTTTTNKAPPGIHWQMKGGIRKGRDLNHMLNETMYVGDFLSVPLDYLDRTVPTD